MLQKAFGIDLTDLDVKRKAIFAQRTDVNRTLKEQKARLDAIPDDPEAPKAESSVGELAGLLDKAMKSQQAVNDAENALVEASRRTAEINKRIADYRRALAQAEIDLQVVNELTEERQTHLEETRAIATDKAPIVQKMSEIESLNRRWRAMQSRDDLAGAVRRLTTESEQLTGTIDGIDAERVKRLQAVQEKLPGVGIADDGTVLYKGFPLAQASQEEQLSLSVAVGIAPNPKLKIALMDEGSVLDKKHLKALVEACMVRHVWPWIERVGDGEECTILIEDGSGKA
jgi:hypothetical protein